MKIGVLLPTFRDTTRDALDAARRAADVGLDGAFAYDHLWPMGSPERPSFAPFPVLARVAEENPRLLVGPLVARIGLVAPRVLVEQFRSLALVAEGRVLAPLGTGDKLSEAENHAYGIPVLSPDERRAQLRDVARALSGEMDVWMGAGAAATNDVARETGATLNFWNKPADVVAAEAVRGPVNWAGNPREDLETQLDELRDAGSTWAVFAPTLDTERAAAWCRGSVTSQ